MIRFLFRLLASIALAGAVVMAVLDATRSVAASALVMTPLAQSWETAFPASLVALRVFVNANLGTWWWDPALQTVLQQPGWIVLGVLAFLFYAIGRRRERVHNEWA